MQVQNVGIDIFKAFFRHKTQNITPVRCCALNYLQAAESQYIRLLAMCKLKIKNMLERWLHVVPKTCLYPFRRDGCGASSEKDDSIHAAERK